MRVRTHTSLATATALLIGKKEEEENKEEKKKVREGNIYMRRSGPADKKKESICRY
jgi:hypothetical protein